MNLFIVDDFGSLGERFRCHHRRKSNEQRTNNSQAHATENRRTRHRRQGQAAGSGSSSRSEERRVGKECRSRLDELGLHVGSSVRVLSGAVNESILIAVGDSRIGVNFDVAQKIYVY